MRERRISEDQIVGILKDHLADIPVVELSRQHGTSDPTFYTLHTKSAKRRKPTTRG